MTKDVIERAIRKASGNDAEHYDEMRYEGYGPGGVAVIVEVLTDNKNRTAGEVRATFTKAGGNLAETGAVSFMFDHVGVVEFDAKVANADQMLEAAIEAGAEDVVSSENGHEIYTTVDSLRDVAKALEAQVRRAAQGRAGLEAEEHGRRRRREGRADDRPARNAQRERRRAERLCQFRNVGRGRCQDERVITAGSGRASAG